MTTGIKENVIFESKQTLAKILYNGDFDNLNFKEDPINISKKYDKLINLFEEKFRERLDIFVSF